MEILKELLHRNGYNSTVGAQDKCAPGGPPPGFIPLHLETRTHVPTAVMCWHLNRKAQTGRGWACHEDGPLRATHVCGRLAWAVADIRRLLGATK